MGAGRVIEEKWPFWSGMSARLSGCGSAADLGRAPRTIDAYARGLAEYLQVCERDGIDPVAATRAQVGVHPELTSGEAAGNLNVLALDPDKTRNDEYRTQQKKKRIARTQCASTFGPRRLRRGSQLPDEHPDLSASRGHRVDAVPLADLQVLSQAAGIRVVRPRRTAQISPDPQPLSRALMPDQNRPLLLNPRPRAHPRTPPPVSSSRRHYPAMISTRRRHAAQIPRN